MASNPPLSAELAALATHLHSRRETILSAWRRAVEHEPDLRTAATMSRVQFHDHIPDMLDALETRLRAIEFGETLQARREESVDGGAHGVQRWQQGYNDRQVMREWIALNACLADELQAFSEARPGITPALMSEAWRHVSEFAVFGISESVAAYARLQQTEAAGRLAALEDALAQFEQLERYRAESWREAAHDLRGNLSLVENVSNVLLRQGVSDKWLRMLGSGVASLNALLNDLTTQARLDAGHEQREVTRFDAASVIAEMCANAQAAAAARELFLHTDGVPSLSVEGDQVKVCRIVQNLLINALKYTQRGGVRVSWGESGDGGQRWFVCVADTGPGLAGSAAPLAVALESATQDGQHSQRAAAMAGDASADPGGAPTMHSRSLTAPSTSGEGIGLSIVKRLCDLLDASLELQTEAGEGTTFRVTLPSRYPGN